MTFRISLLTTIVAVSAGTVATDLFARDRALQLFEKRIRPVLVERCYKCHSTAKRKAKGGLRVDTREALRRGGDSGPSVVPGNPSASKILDALSHDGDFFDMPPDGKLSDKVIGDFRRWIELGAEDPREEKTEAKPHAEEPKAASASELWSLQPIRDPAAPKVTNENWPADDLDRFVLARLEAAKLSPSADADRYTWIRRVTVDLLGLPPTIEEIRSFVEDDSPGAFTKVVDRLLASPHFGERWGRHWLDLSCYADLGDIDGNVVVRDAWRYRDWVIDAFTHDKPVDRFIREQIAGDLMTAESDVERREQIIATGFLAIGPWTLQDYLKGQLRSDVADHQIDKIGRSFLGMTISCARCHDHKFDPISIRDYYAMTGIFYSTLTTRHDGPGVWSAIVSTELPELPEERAGRKESLVSYRSKVEKIDTRMAELEAERARLIEYDKKGATEPPEPPTTPKPTKRPDPVNTITLEKGFDGNERDVEYTVAFDAAPSVWAGAGQASDAKSGLVFEVLRKDGSILHSHTHRPGPWPAVKTAQALKSARFTYRGDGSGVVRIRIAADPPLSGRFGGAVDNLLVSAGSQRILAESFDRFSTEHGGGTQAHTGLRVFGFGRVPGWAGGGINHTHAVKIQKGDFAIQLYAGNPGASAGRAPAKGRFAAISSELGRLRGEKSKLDYYGERPPQALAVRDIPSPRDAHVHVRGNYRTLGDRVERGTLTSLGLPARKAGADSSGRLELAEWLADPRHPLTSRVLTNRVWHHVFGRGLVPDIDYFGAKGELPSHPDLLDHLATRLTSRGGSLKDLVRALATSRTYRMASTHDARAAELDPDNRWFWRMSRRRLEAEAIRDSLLALTGRLSRVRGGATLGIEIPGNVGGIGGNVNPPTYGGGKKIPGLDDRRTIYQRFKRKRPEGELELLAMFDFPHPNEITGSRPSTTVATQALFLLNSGAVKSAAKRTAERLLSLAEVDDDARVRKLYFEAFARPASDAEVARDLAFLKEYGQGDEEAGRTKAWTEYCHAILISNRFLFRE